MARISSICSRWGWGLLAGCLGVATVARGDSQLLYFEAQGIAGYSSVQDQPIFYSMNPDAEMQKPSVGFDYIRRFSAEGGDWGSAALQGRLALVADDGLERVEPQAYNAWVKDKTPWTDVWVGHNRPALGLGSYFDSHALILRTLPIQGFGYDRDWGVGTYRDFDWGNLQLSATTGSGMPMLFKGNHMFAGRLGYGVLNDDNYTIGVSAGQGRTLDTMGYTLRDPDPAALQLAGVDVAFLRNSLEHRFDLLTGTWLGESTTAAMYRLGLLLDPEGRNRIELQPTYWTAGEENWLMSLCYSSRLTADLTLRTLYEYDDEEGDHRAIVQLYYYMPM